MIRMKIPHFVRIACSALSLTVATAVLSADKKPNIVFFIADDMYPEMFNCLPEGAGQNLTPNLDRLAREGTLMTHQYVVSPVCTPSRYNCLTGRFASRATNPQFLEKTEKEQGQTVIQWNSFITKADKTLAHYLKDLGYETGFVGKNHVIEVDGLHSFEDFHASAKDPKNATLVRENYQKVQNAILASGFDYAEGIYHNNPNFIGLAELAVQNHDWIAQAGIDFIEANHDDPFFLYFATTIPHGPVSPERSWKADPLVTAAGYLENAPTVLPPRETLPQRIQAAELHGENKELVLWLDDSLGALIRKLEEHDILENTIIFFFNDHGQHAKGTLYQGGTLNPSIIWKHGGFEVGNQCDTVVSNVDFAPTILEMAGAEVTEIDFDGVSFSKVLKGQSDASKTSLYFELGYARAVIKDGFKYIALRYPEYANNWTDAEREQELKRYNDGRRFRDMNIVNEGDASKPFSHLEVVPGGGAAENASYGMKPGYFDPDQLYDLKNDPEELVNLAKNPLYRAKLLELQKELQSYLNDLPGHFALN